MSGFQRLWRRPVAPRRGRPSGGAVGIAILVSVAASTGALKAQARIELVPHVGSFLAARSFGSVSNTSSSSSTFKSSTAVLVGARLRFEFQSQYGLEAGVSFANNGWTETATFSSGSSVGQSLPGSMVVGELRATFKPRRSNAYLLAGVAYSARQGDAWDGELWDDITNRPSTRPATMYTVNNLAAIAGFGLRAQASPNFALDVSFEAHIAPVDRIKQGFALGATDFKNKSPEVDLMLKIGVPITLRR